MDIRVFRHRGTGQRRPGPCVRFGAAPGVIAAAHPASQMDALSAGPSCRQVAPLGAARRLRTGYSTRRVRTVPDPWRNQV